MYHQRLAAIPDPHASIRRSVSLVEIAYQAIVEAIIDREIAPGSRLSIDGLAARLEMSITPIREALSRAAAEHLVIQDARKGFTVAPLLTESDYHKLFDVRRLLELHALSQVTSPPDHIDELATIVAEMKAMDHGPEYRDFSAFNHADRYFHHQLVSLSKNQILVGAWENLHFHLHVGRLYAGAGVIDFREAVREHEQIVDAVRTGDRSVAVQIARQHMSSAEERLVRLIPPDAVSQSARRS